MTKPGKRASLIVVFAVLAALLLLRGAIGGEGRDGPADPSVVEGETTTALGAESSLDSAHEARALEVMKADRGFRAAVAGVDYQVTKIGPWTTSNNPFTDKKKPKLIGVSIVVALSRPVAFDERKLPSAIYDVTEKTSPPYQEVTNRVTARNVSELMVLVDLKRNKVVSVTPGPGSAVVSSTPPPGFERTVPVLSPDAPEGG